MSKRRVVVTGLGLVTPLGVGVKTVWKNLLEGQCGIVSLVDKPGFEKLPVRIGALVPQGSAEEGKFSPGDWLDRGDERTMAKFTQYALSAAKQALNDANWKPTTDEDRERTGVCIGSGMGSLEDVVDTALAYDKGGFKKVSPMFVPRILINMAAGHLTMKYGFQGPNHAVSTACTTGAHSIGDAMRFIQYGDADVMVAGGTEAAMHPLAMAGFARAKSLATGYEENPTEACRPFDSERSGFVMGEGAGVVVLEEYEHARERGAKIYAELKSYGLSGDAHHMTSPPPDGYGAANAMKRALASAQMTPADIDYVNAHATGTPAGDLAETMALRRVYEHFWEKVKVSSTKGATGHLLGAAGAVESIFSVLSVHHNVIPPTLNLKNIQSSEFVFDCVPNVAREQLVNAAMTNSFGFGGTNASLIFSKV